MRSLDTTRMPLTPWRDSIHNRVSSALTRMPNPLRAVTWQSRAFIIEAFAAGYLKHEGRAYYLAPRAIALWFVVNPCPAVDPDVERRRDLVPYAEVLREFGPEIAHREARPPIEVRQRVDAAVAKLLAEVGYDTGRAA